MDQEQEIVLPGEMFVTYQRMTDVYSIPDWSSPVFGLHAGAVGVVIALVEGKFADEKATWAYILLCDRRLAWVTVDEIKRR